MDSHPDYITFAEAAKLFPGDVSSTRVWRWARNGLKARNGHRLHLQHARVGRKLYTTAEWCHEFVKRLAEMDVAATDEMPKTRPFVVKETVETMTEKRRRQIEAAKRAFKDA